MLSELRCRKLQGIGPQLNPRQYCPAFLIPSLRHNFVCDYFCLPLSPNKIKIPPAKARGILPVNYSFVTLIALGPLGPFSVSKLTESPSARLLKPLPWIEVWCTKTSLPSSLVIKPKPFESLNHFTVPLAISFTSFF